MGALADRFGPRLFMGVGPLVAAAGLLLVQRIAADVDYVTDVLPALLVFSLGLSMTVAPLTATVLADADESNAGIASGVNNAIARVAGLLGDRGARRGRRRQFSSSIDDAIAGRRSVSAARVAVASAKKRNARPASTPLAPPRARRAPVASAVEDASVRAFHVGDGDLRGARRARRRDRRGRDRQPAPRRRASECPGGQIVAAPEDSARERVLALRSARAET